MKKIENICYSDIGHPAQKLDLYLPEAESFPIFVYFHGGGIESGDKADVETMITYLLKKQIAVASVNYRMYPTAVYPEFIRDAAASVAWVRQNIEQYGSCTGIFVGGSSAGGYLSMMLCFDKKYFAPFGFLPTELAGFVHDAGQPTCHFNVLRERGLDSRLVVVDESAPMFHIGREPEYAPMQFIVSDDDMENRYEQTMLMLSTLKHFGYQNYDCKLMHGTHCQYVGEMYENGESILGKIVYEFIQKTLA